MRDRSGLVRVMDFGIAKQHGPGAMAVTVTGTGGLMGTPEYMSPEQLRGEEVDFRSDLYSFGIVIYELFTGALPFRGDTPVATIVKQLQDEPDLDLPRLPATLRPVLRRALSKDPSGRYRTAEEMHRVLRDARTAATAGAAAGSGIPGEGLEMSDETRPLDPPVREPVPVLRIALALAATLALAAHLVGASRVPRASRLPALAPAPAATASPTAEPTPSPSPTVTAVASSPSIPPRPSRHLAGRRARLGTPAAPSPMLVGVDRAHVYREDQVDVPPRRISGTSAPYPEWQRRLSPGEKRSITASFVVTEAGDVTEIQVENGGGGLEGVLLEISLWKFAPGIKSGVPVKVRVRWRQTFVGS
jgi:serine/threonine protein kinase